MCRWVTSNKGQLGIVLAALLLPGGFYLLAWLLIRKWLGQPEERKP